VQGDVPLSQLYPLVHHCQAQGRSSSIATIMTPRIVVVGAYPPSSNGLGEYNYHLVTALRQQTNADIYVLADSNQESDGASTDDDGVRIIRCWRLNRLVTFLSIVWHVYRLRPQIVWFDLLFSTFGTRRLPAFLGLLSIPLVRALGFATFVTLHHLFEHIDLRNSGYLTESLLNRIGARWATKLALCCNLVTVTLKKYATTLRERYGARNVCWVEHGYFSREFCRRPNLRGCCILVLGKFGTYKRIEPTLGILARVQRLHPTAVLVVAGRDHPACPGYLDGVRTQYSNRTDVTFAGYVPELRMGDLLAKADIMLLPYTSNTGVSGVAHIACSYGLPIVCPRLPDMLAMADEQGLSLFTYPTASEIECAEVIANLFTDRVRLRDASDHNLAIARTRPMRSIVAAHLKNFADRGHAIGGQSVDSSLVGSTSAVFEFQESQPHHRV
jgi:glycosyltransferase involved in cell wall biosynthesis